MAKSVPDPELKKAFTELQAQKIDTNKKIRVIDTKLFMLDSIEKITNATHEKLVELPPTTNVYESIGRMYVMTPLEEVKDHLKQRSTESSTRIGQLKDQKKKLEANLLENENNIREMVQKKYSEDSGKSNA